MVTDTIDNRIDILRSEKGISLSALSIGSGISRSTLRRKIVNGDDFTIVELRNLSRYLGVPTVSWFA